MRYHNSRSFRRKPPDRPFDTDLKQVFVAVQSIGNGAVTGRVWSNIIRIEGIRHGDGLTFQESRLIDWLIAKPDGTEEGNFVGKFLDTCKTK